MQPSYMLKGPETTSTLRLGLLGAELGGGVGDPYLSVTALSL